MQQLADGTAPDMSRTSIVNNTFGVQQPESAASVMAEGGRSSGMTGRDDFFSAAAAQATHDSQTTSNMIKESLMNLKQRLNQMKESSALTAKMY